MPTASQRAKIPPRTLTLAPACVVGTDSFRPHLVTLQVGPAERLHPLSSESAPEGYRRRTRWPALVIIGVLAAAALITWVVILKPQPAADNSCNAPGPAPVTSSRATAATTGATGSDTATPDTAATDTAASQTAATTTATGTTALGQFTDRNTLKDTRPGDPATIQLRVVNASGTAGMAKTVTETLRKAGFDSIRDAADDPLYPAADLRCYGEIRYGPAGSQAARTVLIIAPCATLVLDSRFDDSVEFAVGKLYTDSTLTADQQAVLAQIKQAATPPAVIEGVTQAAQPTLPIPALPATDSCPS